MDSSKKKFVDIEAVLKEKNPRLYKWLPGFIIKYIKKTLHEDFMNTGIERYKDVHHLPFNEAAINYLGAQVAWSGVENVPQMGGIIICSNHPLGGLDGMALIKAVSVRRKDIRFLVNDLLKKFTNFGDLFVAVNKIGNNTKDALNVIDDLYASQEALLVFPAGLVSRKQNGRIEDLEWKKSFISKAIDNKKNIVPVFVEGNNSKFFYNFALWRKRFGIKANIEMFYLADEMVKQKNKKIKIYFGKELSWEVFDKSRNHLAWAQVMKKYVYAMGKNPALLFEDFLKAQTP